ncbi:MAG TPA: N-acetylmuramoyl-L-alanine amidase [Burkholderiaceae bacterium]|nr:N-acetylmuramoyl-L-alanine amidase [Burkholderiaceae bacterium]
MPAARSDRNGQGPGGNERRRLIQGAGALVLTLSSLQIARGAALVGVRVWPAQDYTRLTLEHDAPLSFSHFIVKDPLRLVVDIEGLDLTPQLTELVGKIDASDPYIALVRVGQNRPNVVRMVIELKAEVTPQVFELAPIGQYQYRLVLDLHPSEPPDPLMALLQQQPPNARDPNTSKPAQEPDLSVAPATPDRRIAKAPARPDPDLKRYLTVAIDAGHGGEDPGAIGRRGTQEKDVTLAIARRLTRLLESDPDVRLLLTRDGDYFVPLPTRVAKARRVRADLFVSIHADAWIKPDVRGSSVFALSERGATSTAAAWLAKRENDADLIGGVNLGAHDAGIARVLIDLSTTAQINDSLRFGNAVLRELEQVNTLHKARVEQAGFAVLKAPDIPSILVETAFISNPDEERRLKDDAYQEKIAAAIAGGIRGYLKRYPPRPRNPMG